MSFLRVCTAIDNQRLIVPVSLYVPLARILSEWSCILIRASLGIAVLAQSLLTRTVLITVLTFSESTADLFRSSLLSDETLLIILNVRLALSVIELWRDSCSVSDLFSLLSSITSFIDSIENNNIAPHKITGNQGFNLLITTTKHLQRLSDCTADNPTQHQQSL